MRVWKEKGKDRSLTQIDSSRKSTQEKQGKESVKVGV
jgi:hypothetical protein